MHKSTQLAIVIGVLLAGFGVFYHYVIYLPAIDDARQRTYERCKAFARQQYEADWANMCNSIDKSKKDCQLPRLVADRVNKDYQDAAQRCLAEAKLF